VPTQTHDLTFTETEVRKRYVCWTCGEVEREWSMLTLLAELVPGLAPRPLRQEHDGEAPVIVMELLPGDPLGSEPLTQPQIDAVGAGLRRLYDIPLECARAGGIPERLFGPTTLPQTLISWFDAPTELADCRDPALVSGAIAVASSWLADPGHLPEPRLVGIGKADLNPANVLWDGTTCRFVDFEHAGLTEPGYELADHVEHLAGRIGDVYDADALAVAAGLSADERERMQAYRPLWAAFWLAKLLPGNRAFPRNPPGTTERQAVHVLELLG